MTNSNSRFGREVNIRSKITDLKSSSRESQIQKLHTDDTNPPDYSKPITELLNIRIIQDGKIIGTYHLPEEVIVRPKAKKIEIHDTRDKLLIEAYHLVKKNLSWFENTDVNCSEIVLDLHVK